MTTFTGCPKCLNTGKEPLPHSDEGWDWCGCPWGEAYRAYKQILPGFAPSQLGVPGPQGGNGGVGYVSYGGSGPQPFVAHPANAEADPDWFQLFCDENARAILLERRLKEVEQKVAVRGTIIWFLLMIVGGAMLTSFL